VDLVPFFSRFLGNFEKATAVHHTAAADAYGRRKGILNRGNSRGINADFPRQIPTRPGLDRLCDDDPMDAAKLFVAGVIVAGAALSLSTTAGADPVAPGPPPGPSAPDVAPGAAAPSTAPVGPPPPPPAQPSVPEVANPSYGSGSGPLGTIRDLWHQAKDGPMNTPEGVAERPPGAGPAPPLPPGYISMNAPESSNPGRIRDPYAPAPSGPPPPPGYTPLTEPPPPGYEPTGPAPCSTAPGRAAPDGAVPTGPAPTGPVPGSPVP
jgi:hypothetical protein